MISAKDVVDILLKMQPDEFICISEYSRMIKADESLVRKLIIDNGWPTLRSDRRPNQAIPKGLTFIHNSEPAFVLRIGARELAYLIDTPVTKEMLDILIEYSREYREIKPKLEALETATNELKKRREDWETQNEVVTKLMNDLSSRTRFCNR